MSSSRAGFVVPDRCEALIDLHLAPNVNPGEIRHELEAIFAGARNAITNLDLEANFDFEAGGYQLDVENHLMTVLEAVYPRLTCRWSSCRFAPIPTATSSTRPAAGP
jgi:acetylornithine deacetylase